MDANGQDTGGHAGGVGIPDWPPEVWANIVASIALTLTVAGFFWQRHDASRTEAKQEAEATRLEKKQDDEAARSKERQDRADRELADFRARDRADLQFGHSWGGLATGEFKGGKVAHFREVAHVPIENHGKRDGSISSVTWQVASEDDSIVMAEKPAFFEPLEKWGGRGNLTVPAGARRLFQFPLSPQARAAINSGKRIHMYLRQVGEGDSVRGELSDKGVEPRPWTKAEEEAGRIEQERSEELAEHYDQEQAKFGWR